MRADRAANRTSDLVSVTRSPLPHLGERLSGRTPRELYLGALVVAFGVGATVRIYDALRVGFPLTDGGLFYVMVRDLQAANYGLPEFTSYNQSNIPFAYPPLGMYAAALVEDATPFGLLTVFRILPLLYCLLTLLAFFLLARRFLRSE